MSLPWFVPIPGDPFSTTKDRDEFMLRKGDFRGKEVMEINKTGDGIKREMMMRFLIIDDQFTR